MTGDWRDLGTYLWNEVQFFTRQPAKLLPRYETYVHAPTSDSDSSIKVCMIGARVDGLASRLLYGILCMKLTNTNWVGAAEQPRFLPTNVSDPTRNENN